MNEPEDIWKHLRLVYERRAEQYQAYSREDRAVRERGSKFRGVVSELCFHPSGRVLEVGCGDGAYIEYLNRTGPENRRVFGIDISLINLQIARRWTQNERSGGGHAHLVVANAEALPFRAATFRDILCTQVIEHLLDELQALREMNRVLVDYGTLLLTTDNKRAYVSRALNYPRDALVSLFGLSRFGPEKLSFPHKAYETEALLDLLREARFQAERVKTFRFHWNYPFYKIRPLAFLLNILERWFGRLGLFLEYGDIILVKCRKAPGNGSMGS
jgi:ubiquinone/menaquinone biosynthesis C-methylase UbiE